MPRSISIPSITRNLICYSKSTPGFDNTILVVVNIDSFNEQSGWTNLDLDQIGVSANESFVVEDLLSGAQYVVAGSQLRRAAAGHSTCPHLSRQPHAMTRNALGNTHRSRRKS